MSTSYNTPTFNLKAIKNTFNTENSLRTTKAARKGAVSLGMSDLDIVSAIQSIKSTDFHKTMRSNNSPKLGNFDVYRTQWNGKDIYMKFQYVGDFIVVSFKQDGISP